MKRLSASVFLILFLQNFVHGQPTDTFRRWYFGVMAGPQFSRLIPKDPGAGWTTGIFSAIDVSYALQHSAKGWSVHFQPGVNGSRSKRTNSDSTFHMTWKSKVMSVNLPLLVRYTFLEGKIRPFAEAGASYLMYNSWSLKGEGYFCQDGGCYPNEFDAKIKNSVKKGRFSALAGVGVEFDLGKVTIPVTVRWNEQLLKKETFYDPVSATTTYASFKSRTIQVAAGITF
ncbi:MAG: outer membrane beta-barrel protein [Dyadobacter sp.]|uniref:outer membrane beta-barrel protein n=1 Tax=Dyadobacter sp. TaxID=1914288 RepID=UPI001B1825D4|nr:outer membrane beta-barrel protein [Dyadobacter sp.]MBO9617146.1 outer membrane beta-barrel protein [Dyadobacter sp.]